MFAGVIFGIPYGKFYTGQYYVVATYYFIYFDPLVFDSAVMSCYLRNLGFEIVIWSFLLIVSIYRSFLIHLHADKPERFTQVYVRIRHYCQRVNIANTVNSTL